MSKPSHLVPNLNEMIEEYAEGEEEAAQETQLGALQNKERQETEAECKTRENSNFLKKGKIVISVENLEFF